jgi:hypothetical protein
MLTPPRRLEIDHRTIKLIIGIIALAVAPLTRILAAKPIESVSASYYEGGWSQSIFVGFLFAIAALLLSYNGYSRVEMIMSKVAAIAGLGVALFPCQCHRDSEQPKHLHGLFAAIMFLILAYFCYAFLDRARAKAQPKARARVVVYAACGVAILLAIVVLGLNNLLGESLSTNLPRITFYGEAVGLTAFGISWLTASRTLPLLTERSERFSPLRAENPP